jgi:hypothetical protein
VLELHHITKTNGAYLMLGECVSPFFMHREPAEELQLLPLLTHQRALP